MAELNFLGNDDVASKRGSGKGRYTRYISAVVGIVDDIRSAIDGSDKDCAVISVDNIKATIEMTDKSETAVHRGLKFALWKHDIIVDVGDHATGRVFIFRHKTDDDKLPDSLAKLL